MTVKTIPITTAATDILKRTWRVRTTNISAISNAQLEFTFDGAEVTGSPDLVTRQQSGSYYPVTGSFYTGLVGTQKFGVNTTGNTFLEETWGLAKSGTLPKTYFSYASGSYDDSTTWTTDPTGSFLLSPPRAGGPNNNDIAVILTGRTVTMPTGAKTLNGLLINAGGILDAGALTTNSFGIVSGQGTLRLNRLAMPTGVFDAFVSQGGGTIQYYNISGDLPSSQLTYCNLSFAGTGSKTFATASGLPRTYTLNGNLSIDGGTAVIGSNTQQAWITVLGNVTIAAGCTLSTNNSNAGHQLDIAGNFTNNGIALFTNRIAPFTITYASNAATDGFTRVRFLGRSHNTAVCNSLTNFYSIEVQKGQDPTWSLTLSATDTTYFNLLGQNSQVDSGSTNLINTRVYQGLATRFGTIVLGSKIKILSLSTGQWRVNNGASVIIDGANVALSFLQHRWRWRRCPALRPSGS